MQVDRKDEYSANKYIKKKHKYFVKIFNEHQNDFRSSIKRTS